MSYAAVQEVIPGQYGDIIMSEAACKKILTLLEEECNPDLKLRVFVEGGGCSGLKYGFTFDEDEVQDDDTVFNRHGLIVLVDPLSLPYLNGAEIAYKEDPLFGAKFTVNNPNASSTCGCGSSFNA